MEILIVSVPSPDPSHLAFGVVNDLEEEPLLHISFGDTVSEVSGNPSILESEGIESFP